MKRRNYNFIKYFTVSSAIILCLISAGCGIFTNTGSSDQDSGILSSSDDATQAVQHITDANNNLRRIKILYTENNRKFEEFKKALADKDIENVQKLADELQFAINDGYVLAESAKEDIAKAQGLNINDTFKKYLQLKEASLDMQIKAFGFRKKSAELFRDKFGTVDEIQLKTTQELFKQNEAKFAEYMKNAEEISTEADKLAKDSINEN